MGRLTDCSLTEEVEAIIEAGMSVKKDEFYTLFSRLNESDKIKFYEDKISSGFENVMKDIDLVACMLNLLKNNLNISQTSREAFIHRNTLIYRIEKIRKLTGLDVACFEDALLAKNYMVVYYVCQKLAR